MKRNEPPLSHIFNLVSFVIDMVTVLFVAPTVIFTDKTKVHTLYKLREYSFNPSLCEEEVNLKTDFDLVIGEYSTLSHLPISIEKRKKIQSTGYILEINQVDEGKKFVVFFETKEEFIQTLQKSKQNITSSQDTDLSQMNLGDYNCWNCNSESPFRSSFPGDEIDVHSRFLAKTTTLHGSRKYLCPRCMLSAQQEVLLKDSEISRADVATEIL